MPRSQISDSNLPVIHTGPREASFGNRLYFHFYDEEIDKTWWLTYFRYAKLNGIGIFEVHLHLDPLITDLKLCAPLASLECTWNRQMCREVVYLNWLILIYYLGEEKTVERKKKNNVGPLLCSSQEANPVEIQCNW